VGRTLFQAGSFVGFVINVTQVLMEKRNTLKEKAKENKKYPYKKLNRKEEKEKFDFYCIDCKIYCGPRRYERNLKRCSKCCMKFKRWGGAKEINTKTSSKNNGVQALHSTRDENVGVQ